MTACMEQRMIVEIVSWVRSTRYVCSGGGSLSPDLAAALLPELTLLLLEVAPPFRELAALLPEPEAPLPEGDTPRSRHSRPLDPSHTSSHTSAPVHRHMCSRCSSGLPAGDREARTVPKHDTRARCGESWQAEHQDAPRCTRG